MSLDFILVKTTEAVSSIEELEQDGSFTQADYKEWVEQLFPNLVWQEDHTAIINSFGMDIEVLPTNDSLSLHFHGSGDFLGAIQMLVTEASIKNIVVIDVQTSELLTSEVTTSPDYLAWYKSLFP